MAGGGLGLSRTVTALKPLGSGMIGQGATPTPGSVYRKTEPILDILKNRHRYRRRYLKNRKYRETDEKKRKYRILRY